MAFSFGDLNMILTTTGEQAVVSGADRVTNKLKTVKTTVQSYDRTFQNVNRNMRMMSGTLSAMGFSALSGVGGGDIGGSIFGKSERSPSGLSQFAQTVASLGAITYGATKLTQFGDMKKISMLAGPIGGMIGGVIGALLADVAAPVIQKIGDTITDRVADIFHPLRMKLVSDMSQIQQSHIRQIQLYQSGLQTRRPIDIENERKRIKRELTAETEQQYMHLRDAIQWGSESQFLRATGRISDAVRVARSEFARDTETQRQAAMETIKSLEEAGIRITSRRMGRYARDRMFDDRSGGMLELSHIASRIFGSGIEQLSKENIMTEVDQKINAAMSEIFRPVNEVRTSMIEMMHELYGN